MIYPKGEVVYQNLSTEYTDLPQLLSTLKPKGFSGIVELDMAGKRGVFFVVSGDVINAASGIETDPPAIVGEEAVEKLLTLSTKPNGVLNVYQLPSVEVEFAASSLVKPEPLFKDLSTDFVRLDQFIKKLQSEKLTGYIEMSTRKNRRVGKLSLKAGETVGLQITSESGAPSFFERETIPPLLEEFVREGATFSVYRSKGFSIPVKGTGRAAEANRKANGIKERKLEPLEGLDIKEDEIFEVKLEENPAPVKRPDFIDEQLATPAPVKRPDFIDEQLEEKPAFVKGPDFIEEQKVENNVGNGRNEFLTAIQRLFLKMEKFMDNFSEKGVFQKAFKRACVEKSESYHFLDPFGGQFEYQGKKIHLDEKVGTEEFVKAIAECLNLALSYIKKELPKNMGLPPGLKGDIESTFKKYQDIIKPVFNQ
jgi:hypothetical protein